jgi:CRP/FNR family transcriptional regulator, cyclic AMP receptor protein
MIGDHTLHSPAATDVHVRPLLHRSANPDLIALVDTQPLISLERGRVLFAEGDQSRCMYVVKAGLLQVRSGSVVFENVGPGGIVGEMGLVQEREPRSATVYSLVDSEVVEIDKERFATLIGKAPLFALEVMQTLSRRLRVMNHRYHPLRQRAVVR